MSISLAPLDKSIHRELHIKTNSDFSYLRRCMIAVYAAEFHYVSNNFPIFFVKAEDNSRFDSIALLGFETDENLIFKRERVHTTYIPLQLACQPFYCVQHNSTPGRMIICIDEDSPRLSRHDGLPLFNDNGTPSPLLEKRLAQFEDINRKQHETQQFINHLLQHQLLEEAKLDIEAPNGEKRRLNGLYRVNRDLLQVLSDEVVLDMFRRGYLAAIYAHLNSHGQIPRLLALRGTAT